MSDEKLIARLLYLSRVTRDYDQEDMTSADYADMPVATKEAADRIEALEAKLAICEKYRDAYAEMGRIGTQAVRDLETKLAAAEAEAKKYKHAFAAQSRKLQAVLHIEGVKATLAEIKGGNDAESDL